jgi:hypothetical protein
MVRDLIVRLGGPAAVAAWCGAELNGNAVTAWGLRDQIPWRWRASVKALAIENRIPLSAKDEKALSVMINPRVPKVA